MRYLILCLQQGNDAITLVVLEIPTGQGRDWNAQTICTCPSGLNSLGSGLVVQAEDMKQRAGDSIVSSRSLSTQTRSAVDCKYEEAFSLLLGPSTPHFATCTGRLYDTTNTKDFHVRVGWNFGKQNHRLDRSPL